MTRHVIQSADFKRDYVAFCAVAIFFLMLVLEVALAIAIPAYLRHEKTMALQVRRLKMTESFDAARNAVYDLSLRDPAAMMELRLVSWNLDKLAFYLRDYSKKLDSDDIARLQDSISGMARIVWQLRSNRPFSRELELETAPYVNALVKQEEQKQK